MDTSLQNNDNRNTIRIRITRDSVNMGDDCMAPHESEMLFNASNTLTDLLNAAAEYVPPMYDCKWEVMCGAQILGRLISGSETKYQVELEGTNMRLSFLPERNIFCRKRDKIEHLSYFERLEVLYDGAYFSIDSFREYGNVRLILEKEETKITTANKEFALKHGFKHRELGYYDKVLPIDQFEGLRIVRIPNDPHADTIIIDIPKEKVWDELKKRVKSPDNISTDDIISYGADADKSLTEKICVQAVSENVQPRVMNYCPECGKKNDGNKYCTDCGTKLLKNNSLSIKEQIIKSSSIINKKGKIIFSHKGAP